MQEIGISRIWLEHLSAKCGVPYQYSVALGHCVTKEKVLGHINKENLLCSLTFLFCLRKECNINMYNLMRKQKGERKRWFQMPKSFGVRENTLNITSQISLLEL